MRDSIARGFPMDGAPLSKKLSCLEDIRRRILIQALEPGTYLDEVDLAEAYGISRPPLREMLRQLAGEGYVVLHENRGAQVAPMSHKTLRNFFVAAPMIYSAASRLAAEHATPAQIARLKECQVAFRQAISTGDVGRTRAAERTLPHDHRRNGGQRIPDAVLRRLLIDHTRIA
jgi:DNA-binding GntR family transcriptional regulator